MVSITRAPVPVTSVNDLFDPFPNQRCECAYVGQHFIPDSIPAFYIPIASTRCVCTFLRLTSHKPRTATKRRADVYIYRGSARATRRSKPKVTY